MSDPVVGPPGSTDPGTKPDAVPDAYVFSSFDGAAAAETPGRRRAWRIAAVASVGLVLIAVVGATGLMIAGRPQKTANAQTAVGSPIADPSAGVELPLPANFPPGSSPAPAAFPSTSDIANPATSDRPHSHPATTGPARPPHSSQPPVAPPAATQVAASGHVIIGQQSMKCLRANSSDGSPVQLWTCDGSAAEKWAIMDDRTIRSGGLCMDAAQAGINNGTIVQLARCSGNLAQQFTFTSGNDIVGLQSGRCLDARDLGTANGTAIQLWDCWGNGNQKWTYG